MKHLLILTLGLAAIATAQTPAPVFSVKSFGATGDGRTIDTPAINKASTTREIVAM